MSIVEHVKITTINNESLGSILDGINSTRFRDGDSLISVKEEEYNDKLSLIYDGFTVDEPDFHIQVRSGSKCANYEINSGFILQLLTKDPEDVYGELWNFLEYHCGVDFN